MNSEQSSTTAPSSSCAEEATATNLSTESAAVAVSTDNPSTTAIAAAVTAALVAAGISGSTGDKGTEKLKAAVMVSKKGKKGVKGKNFSQAEIDCMLELIEEHMPLSASQWQTVVDEHMLLYPNTDRDVDGLRRKFNSLASKKIPTGDPFIPPDVKKAKKIRNDLSQFSGLKTGSPEKMESNFSRITLKGGALDDESVDFSSTVEEVKDSVEFVGSDSEGDINKVDDDDDDEDKIVARSNLRAMAKSNSKTPTITTGTTSPHHVVTREFSSSTFSKRRDQNRSNKKRRVDEDDDDDNSMNTFMKMFMMQSERERVEREREREDRRRQEEVDREERRLQMAQAKATQDMVQLMLLRSMGMNTTAGLMGTYAPATSDTYAPATSDNNSGANKKSEETDDC